MKSSNAARDLHARPSGEAPVVSSTSQTREHLARPVRSAGAPRAHPAGLTRSASWGVCVVVALLVSGCRDQAAEAFVRAELQHQALLAQAARPEDPRFDGVLTELHKVTPASRHYAPAQKLIASIEAGRSQRVRTPLALAPNGRRPPALEAQLAACARLATIAGLDGGVDRRTLEALEACRRHAERMELQFAHGDEDGGEHP